MLVVFVTSVVDEREWLTGSLVTTRVLQRYAVIGHVQHTGGTFYRDHA